MSGDYSYINKVREIFNLFLFLSLLTIKLCEAQSFCGPESRCVFKWYCSNETVNIYGRDLISIRSNTNTCPRKLQVCCNKENIQEPPLQPDAKHECGLRNGERKLMPMEANGMEQETDFQEFPWVVAIYLNSATEFKFLGGGSIVAPNVVLTAAHIVNMVQSRELLVRAGEWDTQSEDEPFKHRNCSVLETIVHEHFKKDTAIYDIALLVLQQPLALTQHIRPICLPRSYEFLDLRRCIVAGWGKPTFGDDSQFRSIMRKVSLPIVNRNECQEKFRLTRLGLHFELHETFMCAGGEKNLDTCTGDGGSPLFCPLLDHPNQYFQWGIVAWGLSCREENVPGAYADVFYMQTWLRDNLKELNVSPMYYSPSFTFEYYLRENKLKVKA